MHRRRLYVYLPFLLLVLVAGYASRRYAHFLPLPIRKRTGDALWASAVFVIVSLFRPRWSTLKLAAIALLISFTVEFSQLYHAPWIDAIRRTTIGAIILGWAFYWLDLVAYVVGVAFAAAIDFALRTLNNKTRSPAH